MYELKGKVTGVTEKLPGHNFFSRPESLVNGRCDLFPEGKSQIRPAIPQRAACYADSSRMRPRHNFPAAVTLSFICLLTGCASIQAPLPPSLELPKPVPDLRAVRKGNRVYLYWSVPSQTMDRQRIRGAGPTRVCRSLESPMKECGTPVGDVAPPPKTSGAAAVKGETSFLDTLPRDLQQQNPMRLATYAVEALNLHARSAGLSNQVQVSLAPTLPPPPNFRAEVTVKGVVLTWDCVPEPSEPRGARYVYRIYRKSADTHAEVKVAELACPDHRFEDQTIEWQKAYEYRMTVATVIELEPKGHPCPVPQKKDAQNSTPIECLDVASAEGDDSPPQRIFTKDIYPPAVPTGLQAVYSGPGQASFIDLLWAPVTDADLAGYNVYRRESGGRPAKINGDLVKTPAFRDTAVTPEKTYSYSVSAVDERGNESPPSEEASETVPQ